MQGEMPYIISSNKLDQSACLGGMDVINYQRLYEHRFKDVDQTRRDLVWGAIAPTVYEWLGQPDRVLDPAAGRCEFLNAVPSQERWGLTS